LSLQPLVIILETRHPTFKHLNLPKIDPHVDYQLLPRQLIYVACPQPALVNSSKSEMDNCHCMCTAKDLFQEKLNGEVCNETNEDLYFGGGTYFYLSEAIDLLHSSEEKHMSFGKVM
jgi:hypothetical protein